MRKAWTLVAVISVGIAIAVGCTKVRDQVVVRITDNEGAIEPRVITVGYVNDRLDHMPPRLMPTASGEEGKREFLDEIIRKELMVVAAERAGLREDPRLDEVSNYFEKDKAQRMLMEELVDRRAEPTDDDIRRYNDVRETNFQMQEIVVASEEEAWDVYRRVTEGGEDFGRVAIAVSLAASAPDGGRQPPRKWTDYHPVIMEHIRDLDTGDVTEPFAIGINYYILKINSRKDLPEPKALEGSHLAGVTMECRNFLKGLRERELDNSWMERANLVYNDEGFKLASERLQQKSEEIFPEDVADLSFDERMELARKQVLPDFSEDESAIEFVTYRIGDTDHTWTLGDLRATLEETPGLEAPKTGDPAAVKYFVWRLIKGDIMEQEIEERGYKESQELRDYVHQRQEEFIVDLLYDAEVTQKINQPTGEEIKEYFREHRADYKRPPKVDVQQLIVGTEAEANLLLQRLEEGEGTFSEFVRQYSIDEWSKSRDGVIEDYYQGEKRLAYLQPVVFTLKVGEISRPTRAPGGYGLFKVLETYPEEQMTFSDVADMVKNNVITLRKEARLKEFLDEIRETVTVEIIDSALANVKDPAEVLAEKEQQRVVVSSG